MRLSRHVGVCLISIGMGFLTSCSHDRSRNVTTIEQTPLPAISSPPPIVAAEGGRFSAGETIWHMRSALNVAALSCRGGPYRALSASYNRLLRQHRAVFAEAYNEEQSVFRSQYGTAWQTRQDAHITALYNRFSRQSGKPPFCSTAAMVLADLNSMPSAQIKAYAPSALAELEHPRTRGIYAGQ